MYFIITCDVSGVCTSFSCSYSCLGVFFPSFISNEFRSCLPACHWVGLFNCITIIKFGIFCINQVCKDMVNKLY